MVYPYHFTDTTVPNLKYLKTQNLLKNVYNLYKIYIRGDPRVRARKLFKTIFLLEFFKE